MASQESKQFSLCMDYDVGFQSFADNLRLSLLFELA